MSEAEIARLTAQLGLIPHPSGLGAFKEMWRGDRQVTFTQKTSHSGPRSTATSIYFLLSAPHVITWHRHFSDESFYWHAGGRVKIHMIKDDGSHVCVVLGDVVKHAECAAQVTICHDTWYSAELVEGDAYSLYSAVVMPGFEFEDWTEGKREDLLKEFPLHEDLITRLT